MLSLGKPAGGIHVGLKSKRDTRTLRLLVVGEKSPISLIDLRFLTSWNFLLCSEPVSHDSLQLTHETISFLQ
jgi:hypothetical protein